MDAGRREARMVVGEERLELDDVLGEAIAGPGSRRSACQVRWSVPGARPRPRSMRPGWSAARVPNCSANDERAVVGEHDAAGADAN